MQLHQSSDAPNVTPPQDSAFYNRLAEQTKFLKIFSDTPGLITVLVGPPNCGKTAFLKYLVSQLRAKPDPPLILMIDSRLKAVTSPEEISKALCDAVVSGSLMERAQSTAGAFTELLLSSTAVISTLGAEVGVQLENIKDFFAKDEDNLAATLEKLDTLFEKLKQLPNQPVIILDEANDMMDWHEPGASKPNLKKLLSFLTAITKQDKLAHVVLATSDYFLASWLYDHGMTNDKFKVEVLGDLTEQEAREFVYGGAIYDPAAAATEGTWPGIVNDPSKLNEVPRGAEEQWQAIYERCGGNIGLLIQCVAAARVEGNWKGALRSLTAGPHLTIEKAFKPMALKRDVAPLWTRKQWELVLQEIVKAPHHAVLQEDLEKKLEETVSGAESAEGENILMSMVKYNLLALRPPSELARDLPPEVYGVDELDIAVTLPLPVHVWAAKKLLERRVGEWCLNSVLFGVGLAPGSKECTDLISRLVKGGYPAVDISDLELAQVHLRHLIGGHPASATETTKISKTLLNERIFQVEFPERPGALRRFLPGVSPRWLVTLFHYRRTGNRSSGVLLGLDVPLEDADEFAAAVAALQAAGEFTFTEVGGRENEVFKLFLQ